MEFNGNGAFVTYKLANITTRYDVLNGGVVTVPKDVDYPLGTVSIKYFCYSMYYHGNSRFGPVINVGQLFDVHIIIFF